MPSKFAAWKARCQVEPGIEVFTLNREKTSRAEKCITAERAGELRTCDQTIQEGDKLVTLAPLDLVSAHPWRRVAFTTYALSLSFFEAVILDALVRGGGREAIIFADVQGVRASLSEQGARRVGKDYEVEPVAVSGGVFHPKLSVFCAAEECHLLVGSGNLTFGGWGGNCEVLEHLHPALPPTPLRTRRISLN